MKVDYTKEQADQVLKDYCKFCGVRFKGAPKKFLSKKFPETDYVGKVWKHRILDFIFYCDGYSDRFNNAYSGYGINEKEWFKTDYAVSKLAMNVFTQATKEEWEEALIKEAKRRGFVEGAKYKCPYEPYNNESPTTLSGGIWLLNNNGCDSQTLCKPGNPWVMKNGIWADIVEKQKLNFVNFSPEKLINLYNKTQQPKEIVVDGVTYIEKKNKQI